MSWNLLRLAGSLTAVLTVFLSINGEAQPRKQESGAVQLVINGALKNTWTTAELMRGRFDWESPKKKVYPAVPLTFLLFSKESGLSQDVIAEVKVLSAKGGVEVKGAALSRLKDLLLALDVDRGGAWELVARDQDADRQIAALIGVKRVSLTRVQRIEVTRKP